MAVIESQNRILRAGEAGAVYHDGDYIHIDENNRINFTGDFSGLSSKVDECCEVVTQRLDTIDGEIDYLSGQITANEVDLTPVWSAINENSANISAVSSTVDILEQNTALLNDIKLDKSAYNETVSPWCSSWKVIGEATATWGGTITALSSIDCSGTMNHAIGVKGAVITLPSTANIQDLLDAKLDKSAYDNFISAEYNPRTTELYERDSYLSGRIDAISGEAVPWLSSWKDIQGSYTASWGDTFQFLSSIQESGYKNHAVGVKGMNITFPSTAGIQSLLDDKLAISSFENYSGTVNTTINGLFDLANSAYTTALNNYYNKADKSALSAYVPYSAISGDDNIITGINGSALAGGGATYTEGPNIKITGTEISGRDWSNDITAASSYAYEQATAAANVYDVSGGDNINVATADNTFTISGRNWSDTITAASSYAYEQAVSNITAVSYADTANISNSALTASYALSSDSATYDSDGNKITETYLSAIPGDVITTASMFVSSVNNLTPEIVSGGINGHELKLSGSTPTGLPLSGLDPIKIEKTGGKVVISLTGDVGHTYDVSASANISVATAGDTFVISGRDWSDTITAASSYAYSQSTANDKTYDVSGGSNIDVATAGNTFTVSGKDWQNTITAASSYAYSQATANDKTYDVSGGDNISVATAGNTFTVSGKDWTNTITAASAYAASQAQGKTYTGVAPIVVNNTTDQISADCTELIAGDGIEFVTAATGTTINCTASGAQLYRDDQGHIYSYESLTITNRRKVSLNSSEMGYMVPGAVLSSDEGKVPVAYFRDNEAYFLLERITGLLPTSNSFNYTNILQVNAQGVPEWVQNPVQAVANSADATASNVLYIVTGS